MRSLTDKICEFRIVKLRDEDAYTDFYRNQYPRINRFIRARVAQIEVAEELANEAFLEVWRYIYRERQTVNYLQALLLTITRRLIIDHYRKHTTVSTDVEGVVENLSDGGSFLTELELEGDVQTLRGALGAVRSEYREVLILRFLDEFDIQEIAAVLNKTTGAVRVLLHRALAALRKELGK